MQPEVPVDRLTPLSLRAITVRGWSSSAGSEANRRHRVVNGTDIRPRSTPTRRIACNTRRGAMVISPRNTIGVVIAKGLRSPDRDGNCGRPIGLNTSERDDILRPRLASSSTSSIKRMRPRSLYRESGSQQTLCWREMDSNHRFRAALLHAWPERSRRPPCICFTHPLHSRRVARPLRRNRLAECSRWLDATRPEPRRTDRSRGSHARHVALGSKFHYGPAGTRVRAKPPDNSIGVPRPATARLTGAPVDRPQLRRAHETTAHLV